ncbi:hypothetical protein NVP1084O_029 [Vibrio phage 1.084.O._10N.261.49.F5]|nr:hypothetical protein NVP1084O_029 [Vibrio phage 1.084.O._10N.261.49.F5]
MTVHATNRVEIYCDNNQDSIFVEQEKEFNTIELKIGKSWQNTGDYLEICGLDKEMVLQLANTIIKLVEEM